MSTRLLALPLALCVLALAPAAAEAASRVAGDFNGDGHDDLAVGVPWENVGSVRSGGAVNVIYGSASRLTANGNQFWNQDSAGIADAAEDGDEFGSALAAGDFNGDGHDDLAVGVPFEDVGSIEDAGAVNVIYGSAEGLFAIDAIQLWHQDSSEIANAAERDDFFGYSLTAGDFNGSGHDDLAVGVPGEGLGPSAGAGTVNVLYGAPVGLREKENQLWHQGGAGIADAAERGDGFGSALAAGDFNGSGHDDLAVGVPGEGVGPSAGAGTVNVIYGSAGRLTAEGNQIWNQDSPEMADAAEGGDDFGFSLTAGDFNGSGHDDLAVGVPFEDVGLIRSPGAVNVLYGARIGLRARGNELWHQDSPGIADAVEHNDFFGSSLTAGDFNGSGHDDLAVGAYLEILESGSIDDVGAVNVIYGSASRLTAEGNQFWHQDSPGIAEMAEEGDFFGRSLTAADFNGSGHDDLAIGAYLEDVGLIRSAGAVNVIYGAGIGLRERDNQLWHQDSPGIADVAENPNFFGRSLPS